MNALNAPTSVARWTVTLKSPVTIPIEDRQNKVSTSSHLLNQSLRHAHGKNSKLFLSRVSCVYQTIEIIVSLRKQCFQHLSVISCQMGTKIVQLTGTMGANRQKICYLQNDQQYERCNNLNRSISCNDVHQGQCKKSAVGKATQMDY